MSDYIGTNIKTKIIKILNFFLSISDTVSPKDENVNNDRKKKRKKKNYKISEREIYENIMSSSFQSNNSENSAVGQTFTHLNISSLEELWD